MKFRLAFYSILVTLSVTTIIAFDQFFRDKVALKARAHLKSLRYQTSLQGIVSEYQMQTDWLLKNTTWHREGINSGWAGFDKVYFISLSERLNNVQSVAERLGISDSVWIFNAIHKDNLKIQELLDNKIITTSLLQKIDGHYGIIGCQLSHLAVLLDCYNDPNAQTCVIFEDDLYKPASRVSQEITHLHSLANNLEKDWDILFLDYCDEKGGGKIKQGIRWLRGCLCAHAYVVKKNSIPIMLAGSLPMSTSIDDSYYSLIKNKLLIALGPDKSRYFGQNRWWHRSTLYPNEKDERLIHFRFRQPVG